MEYNTLANVEYCYQFFLDSQGLLYYTHIPPIAIALLFASFILFKKRDRSAVLLTVIALVFSLYAAIDLLQWIKVDSSSFIMSSWAVLGLLSTLLFFFTHWFVHDFSTGRMLPSWMSVVWATAFLPVIVFTPTHFNISGYDLRDCIAIEGSWFTNYYYSLGILAILLMGISVFKSKRDPSFKLPEARLAQILVYIGSSLFLLSFLITGVLASYLVDKMLIPDFGLAQYGIAAMSVFIGFLAYVTAYYRGFNLKTVAAQILVTALIILIGAEFLFVNSYLNRILVGLTFVLSVLFGLMLIRSVRQEVRQRELIQKQEQDLEIINKQQENLLHFISHEIKGFLTEGQNAFAGIVEGDYGVPPAPMKTLAASALVKMREGVSTVMNILDASNLKKGTVSYKKESVDLKSIVEDAVSRLRPQAEAKGLTLTLRATEGGVCVTIGDKDKLEQHVIRNLIDNAIKYTQQGSISVSLECIGQNIHFAVKDTGVGITDEDRVHLFTEGGHGKDSIKVNVDSTGYGLFIAKQVTEAHGGTIRAESEGAGKGSEFIVELPVA